ncbi:MAG: cell division protein FtsN [Psychromonas sp.]|uniref:SPOR domain-containing protein n=1 Tax=Psychromonas sp. TaxID=1884585 RepID=UPI0039E6F68D
MAEKRNSRNSAPKQSIPWGPMFLSFAVGAFIMFLLHIKDDPKVITPEKKSIEKKVSKSKNKNGVEPTFEFYTLLPEMEVVVETQKRPQPPVIALPTKPTENTDKAVDKVSYLLQVGSFRKAADADAYKAKLAFLGVESRVQTVTIDNKDTWHRVQIGPVIGRDKADALQKQLKENSIDSLLMRAKNG